ncbi:MAG: DUF427 domain-containing protein [Ardenticatenaceae bacterium]|nr:DUF427 domain-containing protein [Ardenticatenaceae bacterium]
MEANEVITIKDRKTGAVLASAVESEGVFLFEGAWYFDREQVDMTHLVVTEDEYICHYKGTCYWINLDAPSHSASHIAFTYFEVEPGYEFVQGKIGFYAGVREDTVEESAVYATL